MIKTETPDDTNHRGNPLEFVPIFHSEQPGYKSFQSREERNLKKRKESSKQRDGDHHASNQNTTILDEHKNLHGNLYWINNIANPGGKLHQEIQLNSSQSFILT